MPLFERQARIKPGSRSNTKLRVSGGDSPAEKWITDPSLPTLFIYDYGNPAEKEVVISKGMMVAVGDPVRDPDTGKLVNVLTIADTDSPVFQKRLAVGMAPYNFTRQYQDFLYGNQPSIITRDYVELPLFRKAEDAAEVKWGLVFGQDLKAGDFVKVAGSSTGNAGKLTKWDPNNDPEYLIVGQVLAIDENQEPHGWLAWAMWDETAWQQDRGPNRSGTSGLPTDEGYPFDPEYKELGRHNDMGYLGPYTTRPTGIPGLTDGGQKSQTVHTRTFTIPAGAEVGQTFVFDLGYKNIVENSVQAILDSTTLTENDDFTVNYSRGQLTFTVKNKPSADQTLTVYFRAYFFGTPTGWDFKGAVGAARILLKF